MAKRSTRRRSKKRRPDFPPQLLRWLLALALAGGVVFCLVVLARWTEKSDDRRLPTQTVEKPPVIDPAILAKGEVETFLATLDLASHDVQRDLSQTPYRYQVVGDFPSQAIIDGLARRLQARDRGFAVHQSSPLRLLTVAMGEQPVLTVQFQAIPVVPSGPRVAIIMDDLGRSLYPAQVLLGLTQPVTFAILPGEPHASEFAEMVHAAGREVMLHAPMEPQGYPAVNPGENALMVRYGSEDIQARFRQFLVQVPYVLGVNNHMGSRFTEDSRAMDAVMEVVRERGMFFVDSLTTGRSTVGEVADRYGVPHIARDVFLDNVADIDAITRQIHQLAERARAHGFAVGICHPYPETLDALRRELPKFAEHGIEVVPVSELIRGKRG